MLKFSPGNMKTGKRIDASEAERLGVDVYRREIWSLSLSSGYACPGAKDCLARAVVDPVTGKVSIKDGKSTRFRCSSASQETQYKATREQRASNLAYLKTLASSSEMADHILASLPKKAGVIRIHIAGDFFAQSYLDAWIKVARSRPAMLFYAYTKSLPFWVRALERDPFGIPSNLVLTASHGGKHDRLIAEHGLRSARVVYSEFEAYELGLAIDHDDRLARDRSVGSFALLVHGTQPKESEAGRALVQLRRSGFTGYGR